MIFFSNTHVQQFVLLYIVERRKKSYLHELVVVAERQAHLLHASRDGRCSLLVQPLGRVRHAPEDVVQPDLLPADLPVDNKKQKSRKRENEKTRRKREGNETKKYAQTQTSGKVKQMHVGTGLGRSTATQNNNNNNT